MSCWLQPSVCCSCSAGTSSSPGPESIPFPTGSPWLRARSLRVVEPGRIKETAVWRRQASRESFDFSWMYLLRKSRLWLAKIGESRVVDDNCSIGLGDFLDQRFSRTGILRGKRDHSDRLALLQ